VALRDESYLDLVRALPCFQCGRAPSDAHHHTGAGMALRASDHETMPLCHEHHMAFHDAAPPFRTMSREQRRLFQDAGVFATQERLLSDDVF